MISGLSLFKTILAACLAFALIVPRTNAQSRPGKVKVNGITIAYESFGNDTDEAIILIQGTGATLLHYPVTLCEQLAAKGFYVIRFDNRDVGLSTHLDSLGQPDWKAIGPLVGTCKPAPVPYTLLDMATDVTGLMDALHIDKAHIVGASMGGAIAQLMAVNFPDRVISLTCLASTSGDPKRPQGDPKALSAMSTPPPATSNPDTLADYLVTVYKALGAVDPDSILRKRALAHVINRHWDPAAVNRQLAAVMVGDYCDRSEELSQLKIPTLIIQGTSDPIVPMEAGKELAAIIPNAKFCGIKGMGHDISLKFVDEIADCIGTVASESRNQE